MKFRAGLGTGARPKQGVVEVDFSGDRDSFVDSIINR